MFPPPSGLGATKKVDITKKMVSLLSLSVPCTRAATSIQSVNNVFSYLSFLGMTKSCVFPGTFKKVSPRQVLTWKTSFQNVLKQGFTMGS